MLRSTILKGSLLATFIAQHLSAQQLPPRYPFLSQLDAFAEFYPDSGIKGGNDWIDYSEYDCTGDAYRYIKDQGEIKMLKTFGYRYFIQIQYLLKQKQGLNLAVDLKPLDALILNHIQLQLIMLLKLRNMKSHLIYPSIYH